ncbi:hypothetical protein PAPYR_8976 [Paratrimastix pyriformis]|uniref:Mediator complex subunit Med12 domain-containing protein n=1 Tax=Paratrimastix pyriformis TaxID=342808 RepID=A0ABQ8UGL1_9EUKA|nr:hypothetical protein PAPYR_8976 [Paratrimastix pyriformis]
MNADRVKNGYREANYVPTPFETFVLENSLASKVEWNLMLAYFVQDIQAKKQTSPEDSSLAGPAALRLLLSFPQQRILPPKAVEDCIMSLRRQWRYSLRSLTDRIPQGISETQLLPLLAQRQVSLVRASWLVKVVFLNRLASGRRTIPLPEVAQGTSSRCLQWTRAFIELLRSHAGPGRAGGCAAGPEGLFPEWNSALVYAVRTLVWQLDEGLLDLDVLIKSLLALVREYDAPSPAAQPAAASALQQQQQHPRNCRPVVPHPALIADPELQPRPFVYVGSSAGLAGAGDEAAEEEEDDDVRASAAAAASGGLAPNDGLGIAPLALALAPRTWGTAAQGALARLVRVRLDQLSTLAHAPPEAATLRWVLLTLTCTASPSLLPVNNGAGGFADPAAAALANALDLAPRHCSCCEGNENEGHTTTTAASDRPAGRISSSIIIRSARDDAEYRRLSAPTRSLLLDEAARARQNHWCCDGDMDSLALTLLPAAQQQAVAVAEVVPGPHAVSWDRFVRSTCSARLCALDQFLAALLCEKWVKGGNEGYAMCCCEQSLEVK